MAKANGEAKVVDQVTDELLPVDPSKRTWNAYHFWSLWIAMDIGIPTYYLASGLIAGGMNLLQSMMTILLGQCLILIPILLNGHAGTKYGITSAVYWRSAFGFNGASVAAVTRTIVSAGWFGIQIWIGGQSLNTAIAALFPAWAELS